MDLGIVVPAFAEEKKLEKDEVCLDLTRFSCFYFIINKISFCLLFFQIAAAVVGSKKKKKSLKAANSVAASNKTITASLDYSLSVSSFKENCFAASRQQQSRFFECRHLIGHTNSILPMEFSTDGSFIVSGGGDKTVRLWSLSSNVATEETQISTSLYHQMRTKHESDVGCVAISPDSSRIFSGGSDSKIFVHDART